MTNKLFFDYETYSPVDISRTLANYAPQAEVLMCGWGMDEDPIKLWVPCEGEPMPTELYEATRDPEVWLVAHNATFEQQVTSHTSIFGKHEVPLERYYCTMTQALEHNLPASLEALCSVFRLAADKSKLKEGRALIKWFCTPDENGRFRGTEPADKWQKFKDYCVSDVVATREIHKMIPRINYPFDNTSVERQLWLSTERMNQRGFGVDVELAEAAVAMAKRISSTSSQGMVNATEGAVKSAAQTAVLRKYILDTYDVELPNMQSATLERAVNDMSLPLGARELISARIDASKASVAKYRKLLQCADPRGRMTSTIIFCGASGTGRDAGRTFQPQNLPRPKEWFEGDYAEQLIAEIKDGSLDLTHSDPMAVMSSALRGSIVPAHGKKLVVSDLSNIEGRIVAWLAGEDWKVQYFRDYDSGKIKFDNYVAAYSKSMGAKIEEVTKTQRQVGKCQELSLGYGSGVGGLLQFLQLYRVDIQELARATKAIADSGVWYSITEKFDWAQKNEFDYGLPIHQWAACEYIKTQWRLAHKNIAQLWADCETAFRMAMVTPDTWFKAGAHLAYKRKGAWVFCRLPSGRVLSYIQPKVDSDGITYMTLDQTSHKWYRAKIYAGKFVAHATQASARDLLFQNMLKAEKAGYTTVMRVHDEIISEVPDVESFSSDELGRFISTPHEWCLDLPLAAAGFETNVRYRKD